MEEIMNSLISAESTWILWAILVSSAALAIVLEQKYKWANKVTGCILALLFMLILSNLNIIPTQSKVYDCVWDYVVPLAVPMLLFHANIKNMERFWKNAPNLFYFKFRHFDRRIYFLYYFKRIYK